MAMFQLYWWRLEKWITKKVNLSTSAIAARSGAKNGLNCSKKKTCDNSNSSHSTSTLYL
jgi:hypothetical protein